MLLELLFVAIALSPNSTKATQKNKTTVQDMLGSDLSAVELVESALHNYKLTKNDHLIVKITTPLGPNTNVSLPKRASQSDSVIVTMPFDSSVYKDKNGSFKFSDILNDIKAKTKKIALSKQNKTNEFFCGEYKATSQVEISLSNCSTGTITTTYECLFNNNKSRWVSISTNKTPVSFVHKCIAPSSQTMN